MTTLELEARLDNLLVTARTETANIDLFAPIQEREECPICMLPLSMKHDETTFLSCCGKQICCGCIYRSMINDLKNGVKRHEVAKCAFCRIVSPKKTYSKQLKRLMKKNNPRAYVQMACLYRDGEDGVIQSDTRALEMMIRAAELDYAVVFGMIATFYNEGIAVERDLSKALEFYEIAAKKGDIGSHKQLAEFHGENGNALKSIEHMKLAASAGCQESRIVW